MMSDDQSMRESPLTGTSGASRHGGEEVRPAADPALNGARAADPVLPGRDPRAQDAAGPAAQSPGAPAEGPGGHPAQGSAKRGKSRSFWRELPVLVVIALAIALLIKTYVVQAFYIPSSSMENTLQIGDKVLVNKLVYHMRKVTPGDIIVFSGAGSWNPVPAPAAASPNPAVRVYDATLKPLLHSIAGLFGTAPGQTDYIKRVIGVPGDHVVCCNAQGLVTVNGVALHEKSYLFPGAAPSAIRFSSTIPPGRLWVMGDNRYVSFDSRLHRQDPGSGTIPESKVIGRAFMIVWPPSRWRVLSIPATFLQPGVIGAALAGPARTASAASADTALARGVAVRPSRPYLPLTAGLAGALPLTWLRRRIRISGRRAARRS